jgi:hypothetical protein
MSVTSLNQVYDRLTYDGVLLTHQFRLQFNGSPVDADLLDITIWANGARVPGREQKVVDFNYYGYPLKMPAAFDMDHELPLTVRCQKSMLVRDAMLYWQSQISSFGKSTGGIKTISPAVARVYLLDQEMQVEQDCYILRGVMPTKIGEITLEHDDPKIGTFDCVMTYQYWDKGEPKANTFDVG